MSSMAARRALLTRSRLAPSLQDAATYLGITLAMSLDIGALASDPGSGQTIYDLSGNGRDFFLGADGSVGAGDPTRAGTPGLRRSGNYLGFSGAQFLTKASANGTLIESIHKDGALATLLIHVRLPASLTTSNGLFGTASGTGSGFWAFLASNGKMAFRSRNVSTNASTSQSTMALTAGRDYLIAFVIDENGGASGSLFYAASVPGGIQTETFNAAYTSPASGSAAYAMQIGALGNGYLPLESGARLYDAGMAATALTTAQLNAMWSLLAPRIY